MYYTYMLRCKDNSIYTGITTDVKRRMKEHKEKDVKGAKYTRRHEFLKLECVFSSENRVSASKLEYHIKRLSKKEKEDIKGFWRGRCWLNTYLTPTSTGTLRGWIEKFF